MMRAGVRAAETEGTGTGVTVAISTLGSRVGGLSLPPQVAGISYLVLIQRPGKTAAAALQARGDVRFETLETVGLSYSRNAALALADGAFVLFSDDDLVLDPQGILALRDLLVANPRLTFAAGWRRERLPRSGRRAGIRRLGLFNSGRICAPELLVRRRRVMRAGIWFDPNFGIGARYPVGEEYAFVSDMLKARLRGQSVPIVTGSHPHESTGDDWMDDRLLVARQALLRRVFGIRAPVIRMLYAIRHRRRLGGAGAALRFGLGY
ncbi:glycosyltransferase family 2 protein [Ruegeria pomeroyi]|nr:glycosyltransferase family 2 protein [Ruegeria pomeroyi]